MSKVYALVEADYWEYVHGIFSSREKAEEWCDSYIVKHFGRRKCNPERRRKLHGFEICEYEIDPQKENPTQRVHQG